MATRAQPVEVTEELVSPVDKVNDHFWSIKISSEGRRSNRSRSFGFFAFLDALAPVVAGALSPHSVPVREGTRVACRLAIRHFRIRIET